MSASVEQGVARPLAQDGQAGVEHLAVADRHRQDVDRLVVPGVRVEVAAEADADRLQIRNELVLREPARPVERHVLDEVRRPELVVVFEDRAGVDDEAQFGPSFGPLVGPDEVRQPVGEPSFADLGVERDQRRGGRLGGDKAETCGDEE